ncbi:HPP family protein [Paraburkholderia sp. ZP32-5]|uniref:HPP family protein n=1 Tax=Paraburkholderia sp. ZP32-5 TaxID=2883245 RepID=UPI001F1B120E|nr:HPP family protein [Paraburkholderia sp. ZP32-5]
MSLSVRRDRYRTFTDPLILGPVLSVALLAAVAKAALLTGVIYVLFPELAALSYDVFKRPAGAWARAPLMLAVTPAVTAAMGTAFTRLLPYSLGSVAMTVAGAILIVRCMRSPIVPAISAAFLPLVFGITSWWYPVSIAAVMTFLAVASATYGRIVAPDEVHQPSTPNARAEASEMQPARAIGMWPSLFVFTAVLLLVYGLAAITGMRLILFPPLVVIAFDMFVHANVRQQAQRHVALPFVCTITAGAGVIALLAFGAGPLSVVASLLVGVVTLRALRLHFPPALTVGLLPQIMSHADWRFVLAVALGTTTLIGAALLARPFFLDQRDQHTPFTTG